MNKAHFLGKENKFKEKTLRAGASNRHLMYGYRWTDETQTREGERERERELIEPYSNILTVSDAFPFDVLKLHMTL